LIQNDYFDQILIQSASPVPNQDLIIREFIYFLHFLY